MVVTAAGRPLARFSVVDLTTVRSGPTCTKILADFGARVLRVERPGGEGRERVFYDAADLHRNKKSVALDLAAPAGREVFLDLVRVADVVLENFRPGVLERLGCAYAALATVNPRVVLCSISAYGQTGPYSDWPAFDLALQAMGGAMSLTGEPGGPPVRMGLPMADLAGGLFGAFAVAGALLRRERTGAGAHVDLSLLDCQVSLLTYIAQYFWTDGGIFLWHAKPPTNFCVQLLAKTEWRTILETPHLAARIDDVKFCSVGHERSPFTDNSYYVDGGGTNRDALDLSYYSPTA